MLPYTLERLKCLRPGETMIAYVAKEDISIDIKTESGQHYQTLLTQIQDTLQAMEFGWPNPGICKIPRERSFLGKGQWVEYTYQVERL